MQKHPFSCSSETETWDEVGGGDGMLLSHMSQTNSFAVKVQQCGLVLSVALLPKYNPNISADIDLLHEFRALPAKANCLMSSI